jgi:hypothetical protein
MANDSYYTIDHNLDFSMCEECPEELSEGCHLGENSDECLKKIANYECNKAEKE